MMSSHRVAAFPVPACVQTPAGRASDSTKVTSSFSRWLSSLVERIRDSLGSEIPANVCQMALPYVVPSG